MKVLGRPRAFDRDAALDAAMQLFWHKGFQAASMNDLCDAMGIRSPSLYAAFGSKESLYEEAVRRYNASADALIWTHIEDGPTARASIQKMLFAAAEVLPGTEEKPSGCLVTMAAQEPPGAVAAASQAGRTGSLDKLRAGLRQAVAAGELPKGTAVDRLSRYYLAVVQGMAIQARDGATVSELKGIARLAMSAWPTDNETR